MEGIGPNVRSRLTNGLVADVARLVIASPEAPREQREENLVALECGSRAGFTPFLIKDVAVGVAPLVVGAVGVEPTGLVACGASTVERR